MPIYRYIARDDIGRVHKGTVEAMDPAGVRANLRQRGLYASEIKKVTEEKSAKGEKVPVGEVVMFTERLSAMVNSGLPLIKCLNALKQQSTNQVLQRIIYKVCLELEGGGTFSDALSQHPRIFSNFYVDMIKTGEMGGILSGSLQKIAEYLAKEAALKRSIQKAFAYPIIVLGAVAVVVTFLLVFIVPIFVDIYLRMGLILPLPTIILMESSKILLGYWWALLGAGFFAVFGFKKLYATDKGRFFIDRLKLNFPIFGPLNRKVAVSRFIRTFASLYASGIAITESLNVVREIAGNVVITKVIDHLQKNVREGNRIADVLETEEVIPPIVTQMIAAGEEAGALEDMLNKSADFLDRDVDYTVDKLVTRLEPVLTVFLAVIIGFIAMAIYLPMFDLTSGIVK